MPELKVDELGPLEQFAAGGQAVLFRAPGAKLAGESGPFVYKQYKDKVIDGRREAVRTSLRSLIRVRDRAASGSRAMIDGRSTWPLAVVVDERGATGCVMREIPSAFFRAIPLSTGRTERVPWSWELHLQHPVEVTARGLPALGDSDVMYLLARVLRYLSELHSLDVVIGDFSSANILLSATANDPKTSRPMFVDVDSYRRGSGVSALLQPHTPGWETPESRRHRAAWKALEKQGAPEHEVLQARARTRIQDRPSDVYKASLLVLRTMDSGPTSGHLRNSPDGERRLRRLCGMRHADMILQGLSSEPRDRPTAADICAAFTRV